MGSFLEIISPLERGRRYGAASASFLFLLILAELEGLMFLTFALVLGRPLLFLEAQGAIFPASWLVAAAAAGAVLWRARTWSLRRKRVVLAQAEVSDSFYSSNWRERIGA